MYGPGPPSFENQFKFKKRKQVYTNNGGTGTSSNVPYGNGKRRYKNNNNNMNNFNNFTYCPQGDLLGAAAAGGLGMGTVVFTPIINGHGRVNLLSDGSELCVSGSPEPELVARNGVFNVPNNVQQEFVEAQRFQQQLQQVNSFHGDHQIPYLQRPQNQQGRFIKVQGCKVKSQVTFRNFLHQQKQQPKNPQNRWFGQKTFHYKSQRPTNEFSQNQTPNQNSLPMGGTMAQYTHQFLQLQQQSHQNQNGLLHPPPGFQQNFNVEPTLDDQNSNSLQETEANPFSMTCKTSNPASASSKKREDKSRKSVQGPKKKPQPGRKESYKKRNNGGEKNGGKLHAVQPKVEPTSPHSLTYYYEDISEGEDNFRCPKSSSTHEDRPQLEVLKASEIKREPGEIYSDEENTEPDEPLVKVKRNGQEQGESKTESKPKTKGNGSARMAKVKNKTQNDKVKKVDEDGKNKNHAYSWDNERPSTSKKVASFPPYSYHDDRCNGRKDYSETRPRSQSSEDAEKSDTPSCSSNCSSRSYCCTEAEVDELREKLNKMKRHLRNARDRLLETKVVGSKKAVRLQEEVDDCKRQLDEMSKKESDLQGAVKILEKDIVAKNISITKLTNLYEAEKQDKAKIQAELARNYQDRLTMTNEKLKGLYELEVAKMQQSFFLSRSAYGGASNIFLNNLSSSSGPKVGDSTNEKFTGNVDWYSRSGSTDRNVTDLLNQNSFLQTSIPQGQSSSFQYDYSGQNMLPFDSPSQSQYYSNSNFSVYSDRFSNIGTATVTRNEDENNVDSSSALSNVENDQVA